MWYGPRQVRDFFLPILNNKGISVMLCGHTHIPVCVQTDFGVQVNPGSVSIPKQDSHRGYIVTQDGLLQWKDLQGNLVREYRYR